MKQRKPTVTGLGILLRRRLAMFSLWYCALAAGFLIVLLCTAAYQPTVAANMVFGTPALSWLTSAEASHMADVHLLVKDALLVAISAGMLLGSYWYNRGLDTGITRGALAMMLALCVLLIPFHWTFTYFHHVFFPHGNWQFPADSWLISTFPIEFFAAAAIAWFTLSVGALWLLHTRIRKNTPKK